MKLILKNIYPYLFLFFCFSIFLDKYATAIPNIILGLLVASFPFVVEKSNFKKLLKKEILVFAALIVFTALNALLLNGHLEDFAIIKKMAASLLLVVLYIPLNETKRLKNTIVIAVLACILICLFNIYGFYIDQNEFEFASGSKINEVLVIDRLYLGFMCVLSCIVSFQLIRSKYHDYNKWYFANIVLNILFILLISSRIAIVILLILFFLRIFYTEKKKTYIGYFAGILLVVILAFVFNKNLSERFFYTHSERSDMSYIELFKTWEQRVTIWDCNYTILQKEPFLATGIGFYNSKKHLLDCYENSIKDPRKKAYFIHKNFNTHNQFIDFLMGSGVIAFVLFCLVLFFLIYKRNKSYFYMSLCIAIVMFSGIESYFQRQIGGYIFAIVCILFAFSENINTKPIKSKNE